MSLSEPKSIHIMVVYLVRKLDFIFLKRKSLRKTEKTGLLPELRN